ncbi:DUF6326 family protein [Kordia sp.]|uniref:DUF6326 family protein n=1 Tax=Kordia sp. TaxID=1965332 RepID=UPI003B5C4747
MRTKLSFLWVFVLLNIIIKDIHDLFRTGLLEEIQSGIVNGNTITEELMLIGGVLLELPILMVVLSQFLPFKGNKWTNIGVAILSILTTFMNPPKDLDDIFFLITTIIGLLTIILFAWQSKEVSNK